MKSDNNISSSSELKRFFITEVAIDCISKKGINGTSMSDISNGSNMSQGNIYRYFSDKMEIMHEALKLNFSRQIKLLPHMYAQQNPLDYILKANFIDSSNPVHLIYDVKTIFCLEKMYYKVLARDFDHESRLLFESHIVNMTNFNKSIKLKEAKIMAEVVEFFITDTTLKRNSRKNNDEETLFFYEKITELFRPLGAGFKRII